MILHGNNLKVLPTLKGMHIHACVTSPPYWGLRAYAGLAPTWWPEVEFSPMAGVPPIRIPAETCCFGNEENPWAFVAHNVLLFREVRQVLRDDATLWLNLGDSYAGSWGAQSREHAGKHAPNVSAISANQVKAAQRKASKTGSIPLGSGLKPKDLCGMPWRVALALQADGWWLRSASPWVKRNPMPESTEDRPGSALEYMFLFAKSDDYFFDMPAVRHDDSGKPSGNGFKRDHRLSFQNSDGTARGNDDQWEPGGGRNFRNSDMWFDSIRLEDGEIVGFDATVAGFKGAHFATFPPKLIEPCIKASTSAHGVCPACGAPWSRIVAKERVATRPGNNTNVNAAKKSVVNAVHHETEVGNRDPQRHVTQTRTTGWEPTCKCDAGDPIAPTVLDPFSGAATTGLVAIKLARQYIGIEASAEYVKLSEKRLRDECALFA